MTGPVGSEETVAAKLITAARDWARGEAVAQRPSLFVRGEFKSHSGEALPWKIECEALTDQDWETLADMAAEFMPPFRVALAIPRGGCKLQAQMNTKYRASVRDPASDALPVLVCDDVLTTGASMVAEMKKYRNSIGLVVFARGPLPPRVMALFAMPAAIRPSINLINLL